jgi:molybdopterin-synthase adenylyltransferase
LTDTRFHRQELLFGREGQQKIEATSVAIAGVGGIGTRVIQDLVLLGTRRFVLIEPGELKESSKNRYVGHRHDDPVPGTPKLSIAERIIRAVSPDAGITKVPTLLQSPEAREAIDTVDVVFGCLDNEGARFCLNAICAELGKRMIDVATEIIPAEEDQPLRYGGRVFVLWERPGCLCCCGVLDMNEAQRELASPEEIQNRRAIYGLNPEDLGGIDPSIATLNGVVASIATTEFMAAVTGLRTPVRLTVYRTDLGKFTTSLDKPRIGCYTCATAASMQPQ